MHYEMIWCHNRWYYLIYFTNTLIFSHGQFIDAVRGSTKWKTWV